MTSMMDDVIAVWDGCNPHFSARFRHNTSTSTSDFRLRSFGIQYWGGGPRADQWGIKVS
jgi:hypothetical protein